MITGIMVSIDESAADTAEIIQAVQMLRGVRKVSLIVADKVAIDELPPMAARLTLSVTVEAVQRAACKYYSVNHRDIVAKDRHKSIVHARHVAMWICVKRLDMSSVELGREFGDRDHTTVLSAVNKIEGWLNGFDQRHAARLRREIEGVCAVLGRYRSDDPTELGTANVA